MARLKAGSSYLFYKHQRRISALQFPGARLERQKAVQRRRSEFDFLDTKVFKQG